MRHLLLGALAALVMAAPLAEAKTARSAAERMAFVRQNPCPATGLRRGACTGYEVDHIVPLCAGGPDRRNNMQWLSVKAHRAKTRYDVRLCRQLKKLERSGKKVRSVKSGSL